MSREAFHGFSVSSDRPDIIALHFLHAFGEIVNLLLDKEEQVALAQSCIGPQTDKVIRKPIRRKREVCLWCLLPTLGQGHSILADDREPRCEGCVEASGTYEDIGGVVRSVGCYDAFCVDLGDWG